jgi:hypothetical protein
VLLAVLLVVRNRSLADVIRVVALVTTNMVKLTVTLQFRRSMESITGCSTREARTRRPHGAVHNLIVMTARMATLLVHLAPLR